MACERFRETLDEGGSMPRERKRRPGAKSGRGGKVVDIRVAELDRATKRIKALTATIAQRTDEAVAAVIESYRAWEAGCPDDALRTDHKTEMVRLGFVGQAGFERCHEPHRLPWLAFFTFTARVPEHEVDEDDQSLAEVMMCPAMQAGRCEPIWRAVGLPPCKLLLLEIHHGLGGGSACVGVDGVLRELDEQTPPDREHEASFRRAKRVKRHHDKLETDAS
jgi:hypothetical protein